MILRAWDDRDWDGATMQVHGDDDDDNDACDDNMMMMMTMMMRTMMTLMTVNWI